MAKNIATVNQQVFLYKDSAGRVQINALLRDETLWLTQKTMADLFEVEVPAISKHIKNIFADGELEESSVVSKMETTAADGKSYNTAFYSLDMIIAVGYRVNSKKATAFRIWATEVLREYITKGFALDDERMKKGNRFGADYFREMLDRLIEFNRKAVLTGKGKISREEADKKALAEYAKYRERMLPLERAAAQEELMLDIKELEKMEAELAETR